MNKANIETLLKALRGQHKRFAKMKVGFNMSAWLSLQTSRRLDHANVIPKNECGTVACIAGTCFLLSADPMEAKAAIKNGFLGGYIRIDARKWLGLDEVTADRLFFAEGARTDSEKITLRKTISVVERLRDTGKVSWR